MKEESIVGLHLIRFDEQRHSFSPLSTWQEEWGGGHEGSEQKLT